MCHVMWIGKKKAKNLFFFTWYLRSFHIERYTCLLYPCGIINKDGGFGEGGRCFSMPREMFLAIGKVSSIYYSKVKLLRLQLEQPRQCV